MAFSTKINILGPCHGLTNYKLLVIWLSAHLLLQFRMNHTVWYSMIDTDRKIKFQIKKTYQDWQLQQWGSSVEFS